MDNSFLAMLGNNLRDARKRTFPHDDLAAFSVRIGVSRATLQKMEKGDLSLDDSFGIAFQAGMDVAIDDHWAINAGVWYIDIDTQAEITAKASGATAAKVKFDVQIDPWVYNVGIAYKF